jgi:hypothetical protein
MWPGDNVNTNQFTDAPRGSRARISCGLYSSDVSADKYRDITRANIFLSQELNVGSFDHGVRSFNGSDETFGFDHTECF